MDSECVRTDEESIMDCFKILFLMRLKKTKNFIQNIRRSCLYYLFWVVEYVTTMFQQQILRNIEGYRKEGHKY
jgi:hypothetical protein